MVLKSHLFHEKPKNPQKFDSAIISPRGLGSLFEDLNGGDVREVEENKISWACGYPTTDDDRSGFFGCFGEIRMEKEKGVERASF